MTITLNGEPAEIGPGTTVGALVDGFGRGRAGIAVALDGDVVPRADWDDRHLDEGAVVDVLSAAQGG